MVLFIFASLIWHGLKEVDSVSYNSDVSVVFLHFIYSLNLYHLPPTYQEQFSAVGTQFWVRPTRSLASRRWHCHQGKTDATQGKKIISDTEENKKEDHFWWQMTRGGSGLNRLVREPLQGSSIGGDLCIERGRRPCPGIWRRGVVAEGAEVQRPWEGNKGNILDWMSFVGFSTCICVLAVTLDSQECFNFLVAFILGPLPRLISSSCCDLAVASLALLDLCLPARPCQYRLLCVIHMVLQLTTVVSKVTYDHPRWDFGECKCPSCCGENI